MTKESRIGKISSPSAFRENKERYRKRIFIVDDNSDTTALKVGIENATSKRIANDAYNDPTNRNDKN